MVRGVNPQIILHIKFVSVSQEGLKFFNSCGNAVCMKLDRHLEEEQDAREHSEDSRLKSLNADLLS